MVLATAPHIGNTGWNDEDDESGQIQVAGYVVRDPAPRPSNWRSRRSLDAELAAQGVVGICDIDTRALTRHIRSLGAMRAGISTRELDPQKLRARVLQQPVMVGAALFGDVSTPQVQVIPARGQRPFRVAAVGLGIKTMSPMESFSPTDRATQALPMIPSPCSGGCYTRASHISGSASATSCSGAPSGSAPTN